MYVLKTKAYHFLFVLILAPLLLLLFFANNKIELFL
jgi:hypothetical protein